MNATGGQRQQQRRRRLRALAVRLVGAAIARGRIRAALRVCLGTALLLGCPQKATAASKPPCVLCVCRAQQQEWAGGGGAGGGGAVLLSADDAAHAADHDAWEDDYSDGSDGGCDEEDALSAYRSGRRLGSMPGRRPVQGKSRRASGGPGGGGGNAAGLASRGSSGSLGGGRRR